MGAGVGAGVTDMGQPRAWGSGSTSQQASGYSGHGCWLGWGQGGEAARVACQWLQYI